MSEGSESAISREDVSAAVINSADPIARPGLAGYELSAQLGDDVGPDDVRAVLESVEWAYSRGDHEWVFDRHVIFSESIDDVLDSYPERYEESDLR